MQSRHFQLESGMKPNVETTRTTTTTFTTILETPPDQDFLLISLPLLPFPLL
jgi:hypothetical protein